MDKVTKKLAASLKRELKGRGIEGGQYETDYGPLNVRIDIEAGSSVLTVFTRFENTSELPPNANPYSGKWNFHNLVKDADLFPDLVQSRFIEIGALKSTHT